MQSMWPIPGMQRIHSNSSNDFNTLKPKQNGPHIADHIFKSIFLYENIRIWIHISLFFLRAQMTIIDNGSDNGPVNLIEGYEPASDQKRATVFKYVELLEDEFDLYSACLIHVEWTTIQLQLCTEWYYTESRGLTFAKSNSYYKTE